MDIDGLGAETIDALVELGFVYNVADLYDLTYEQLLSMDRMADKSARNLLDGLEKSKKMPFEKVLFGLGIRFVGETVSKKLAKEMVPARSGSENFSSETQGTYIHSNVYPLINHGESKRIQTHPNASKQVQTASRT